MKRFVLDPKVSKVLPTYCVGLVAAKGIDNRLAADEIDALLDENVRTFHAQHQDGNIREIPGVAAFREAFRTLSMNPNKYCCSIEALLKRVQKKDELPHINPIVDLGNAFSVKYCLPMGAHDIDRLEDDLVIRFSSVEDHFLPLGETDTEIMPDGELVYVSGHTVKTRRWVWRQSDDGKITEDTKTVVFPIDGFYGINEDQVMEARDKLAERMEAVFNCTVKTGLVDRDNPSFEIEL